MKKQHLSYSSLSQFSKSPNHLLSYWAREFEPTPAMLFGSLLHKMILEPENFNNDYAVYDGRRAGAAWNEFKAVNQEKDIVTQKEYNHAYKTYENAKGNEVFRKLLMKTTETEKRIDWTYEDVKFKGFVDMVGDGFIADIKTTTDAGLKFEKDLYYDNSNYCLQAAMYLEAFAKGTKYYIIAVEKSEPYNVQVYELSTDIINKAAEKYHDLVYDYKEWVANGSKAESYSNSIKLVDIYNF